MNLHSDGGDDVDVAMRIWQRGAAFTGVGSLDMESVA